MADLPQLGYTSLREALAEKFHMAEPLLAHAEPVHRGVGPAQPRDRPQEELLEGRRRPAPAPRRRRLRDMAQPIVAGLAQASGDTAYLMVPDEGTALCVDPRCEEVWVATSSYDAGVKFVPKPYLITHRIDPEIDRERAAIEHDLLAAGAKELGRVVVTGPRRGTNAGDDSFRTDGQAYVIEFL